LDGLVVPQEMPRRAPERDGMLFTGRASTSFAGELCLKFSLTTALHDAYPTTVTSRRLLQ